MAVARLKLDKKVEPLAVDSTLRVRPRSALGLKYIELTPGTSRRTWKSGDTIPVKRASEPLEYEDLFSTFDRDTRPAIQASTEGFGNAFAGRGQSINRAIAALNPFFRALTPVMQHLSAEETELDNFFVQLGAAAAQVAPVARTQAELFTDMADTFAAISADPRRAAGRRSRSRRPRWPSRSTRSASSGPSSPTSPTSRAACGPRRRSCPARCRR